MKEKFNYTGFLGGAIALLLLIDYAIIIHYKMGNGNLHFNLYIIFVVVALSMFWFNIKVNDKYRSIFRYKTKSSMLKKVLWRFIAIFIPLFIFYIILNISSFQDNYIKYIRIDFVKDFFFYFIITYLIVAPYYLEHTLQRGYTSEHRVDFSDYALLIILGCKSIIKRTNLYKNHRVKKVLGVYLLTSFFATLMVSFYYVQFMGFIKYFNLVLDMNYSDLPWITIYRNYYHLIFNALFFIDVIIAVVAYTIFSKWLDNRVRSVNFSTLALFVTLVCYPPFNTYWSNYIAGYNGYETHQLIVNDIINALILSVMIFLYIVYVVATMTLGFKFGNLTDKGIITGGIYSYFRHPSYLSKNLTWIIDKTYVLTNIWASLAFFSWIFIYYLRAKTEEIHLNKVNNNYKKYKVKYV